MAAYFSSKFTKQIQAALALTLLMICMMGTHWIGFNHSVSHAGLQQQSISQPQVSDLASQYHHGSDACHLFDALTLAGFISGATTDISVVQSVNQALTTVRESLLAQANPSAYQSRAPPTFII